MNQPPQRVVIGDQPPVKGFTRAMISGQNHQIAPMNATITPRYRTSPMMPSVPSRNFASRTHTCGGSVLLFELLVLVSQRAVLRGTLLANQHLATVIFKGRTLDDRYERSLGVGRDLSPLIESIAADRLLNLSCRQLGNAGLSTGVGRFDVPRTAVHPTGKRLVPVIGPACVAAMPRAWGAWVEAIVFRMLVTVGAPLPRRTTCGWDR